MQDLIAGRIDYQCALLPIAIPQIQSGSVKAIALLSRERSRTMPALATAREQGLADVDVSNWSAFFLPKGTPPAIVQKLRDATVVTMNTSAIRARLDENGNRFGCSRAQVCRIPARFRQERDQKMGRADQGVRRECRLTDASARQHWPVRPPSDVTASGRGSISGLGQTEKYSARADVFRSSSNNGLWFSARKGVTQIAELEPSLFRRSAVTEFARRKPAETAAGAGACGMVTAAPPRS